MDSDRHRPGPRGPRNPARRSTPHSPPPWRREPARAHGGDGEGPAPPDAYPTAVHRPEGGEAVLERGLREALARGSRQLAGDVARRSGERLRRERPCGLLAGEAMRTRTGGTPR